MQATIGNSPRTAFTPLKQFVYMFILTVASQGFHMVEHIAQVLQKFVFHITPAHGLIGQLDLEQVHFSFNLFYLSTLVAVMIGWFYYGSQISKRWKIFSVLLVFTVLAQSYHMAEHTAKLVQFVETMMQGTPGILGNHFDGVIFHAVMNTVVFVPVVIVFIFGGVYKEIFSREDSSSRSRASRRGLERRLS
jgi:hypothetical protein